MVAIHMYCAGVGSPRNLNYGKAASAITINALRGWLSSKSELWQSLRRVWDSIRPVGSPRNLNYGKACEGVLSVLIRVGSPRNLNYGKAVAGYLLKDSEVGSPRNLNYGKADKILAMVFNGYNQLYHYDCQRATRLLYHELTCWAILAEIEVYVIFLVSPNLEVMAPVPCDTSVLAAERREG